jgi:HSP20 family protein
MSPYHRQGRHPGVKKEDIQIDIDDDRVSVRAEVKQEKEEKKGEKVV